MFRVEFRAVMDPPWNAMSPVRVGRMPPGTATPDVFVTVERDAEAVLRVDVYADQDPTPFREAIVWSDLLVIGFGAKLHIVSLTDRAATSVSLGWYFGHLYPLAERLLVADAEQLRCLDRTGRVLWCSGDLGLDGVVVEDVENGVIKGSGEWDPPGGWRPFRLALSTGERLSA
jgi:hypothetical protein